MNLARLFRILAALSAIAPASGPATAGTIADRTMQSATLGTALALTVYTPSGVPPPGGWPVLYLLHGHDGDARSWPDLGHIGATLDRMIDDAEIAPLVVVMPDAANGWYVDSASVGGPGDYETALVEDLPTWVEAAFPVRTDRGGRAVAGLSMGGYGALRLALAHPDFYGAAASMSGALWQNVPQDELDLAPERIQLIADSRYFHRVDRDTVTTDSVVPNLESHFAGAFGTPFDPKLFNAENVFTLLQDRVGDRSGIPAIYVTVGCDDSHDLWRGAFAFFATARDDGVPVQFRVTGGDHVWSLWQVSVVDVLRFTDRQFTPVTDPVGRLRPTDPEGQPE